MAFFSIMQTFVSFFSLFRVFLCFCAFYLLISDERTDYFIIFVGFLRTVRFERPYNQP